jgi:hypothetical protein
LYDLGCGAGKPLVAAALSGLCLGRCVGVELLPSLAACGRAACASLRTLIDDARARSLLSVPNVEASVETGDFLSPSCQAWLAEADIVYFSSICFSDAMTQDCFNAARGLRPGSRVLTLKVRYPRVLFLFHFTHFTAIAIAPIDFE